jgi:hypothetical protein
MEYMILVKSDLFIKMMQDEAHPWTQDKAPQTTRSRKVSVGEFGT